MKNSQPKVEGILTPDERRVLLAQIARGELIIPTPVKVGKEMEYIDSYPDFDERKAAIVEMNKMDGDYKETDEEEEPDLIIVRPTRD
jgi:hypothetical protein